MTLKKNSLEKKLKRKEEEQDTLQEQINILQDNIERFGDMTPLQRQSIEPFSLIGENTGIPRGFLRSDMKYEEDNQQPVGYG